MARLFSTPLSMMLDNARLALIALCFMKYILHGLFEVKTLHPCWTLMSVYNYFISLCFSSRLASVSLGGQLGCHLMQLYWSDGPLTLFLGEELEISLTLLCCYNALSRLRCSTQGFSWFTKVASFRMKAFCMLFYNHFCYSKAV